MEQQFKQFMASPVFKRAMAEAEKWHTEKKAELDSLINKQSMIESEMKRIYTGKPEHRNTSIIKNVDGTLLRVTTGDRTLVKSVEPVKSFEDLSTAERTQLYETDKKLYKMLEHNIYQPKMTERTIDLMLNEGMMYEEFSLIADTPQKPSLVGLDHVESSETVRQYTTATEENTARLTAFRQDIEAYNTGKIQRDLEEVKEQIKTVQAELA
jgi:hypothetical protein